MASRDEFGAFVVGFLVGGLGAAVVALLYAPQSGEETRKLIKEKSIELRDQAQESLEEALAHAEEMARTLKEQVPSAVEAVRSAAAKKPDNETTA